jgi:CHASE3 domain sensor protein
MAGLLNKIKSFMRSPKGQQMTSKARKMAQDPRNRERARQAAQRLRRKR